MSAYIYIGDQLSEAHIYLFCLSCTSCVFLIIILSGTDAPGEHVLYEALHTKLGMENLDIEEVR